MITTFLFDLGGVLFTNGTKKFIKQISDTHKLRENVVKDIIDGEIGTLYRESKISRDDFWQKVKDALHLQEDADTLEGQWINCYELIPKTKSIIEKLSLKYSLYYLSDNVKERVDALDKKFSYSKLFKGGIYSHEVGARKPNPKIYEFALKKSKSKPEETIFIDDKPFMLIPAEKLRINTLAFTTSQELEKDLIKKGLLS